MSVQNTETENSVGASTFVSVPLSSDIDTRDYRESEWSNYIPHQKSPWTGHEDWHNAYKQQLMDIHQIVEQIMTERYPGIRTRWKTNKKVVDNLSKLIYHCSSKHISPYLENDSF